MQRLDKSAAQCCQKLQRNSKLVGNGQKWRDRAGGPSFHLDHKICLHSRDRNRIRSGVRRVHYRKIEIELIVAEDEAEPVVNQLNAALDGLEAKYEIFGGGIETVAVEHKGTRRRTALKHTIDAGQTAVAAVRMAGGKVADAFRAVI